MNLDELQRNFEALAARDPLWAVLADEQKRDNKWDLEEFYTTGEQDIAGIEKSLANHGVPLGGQTALDFGCGVGRLTFPLSRRFDTCYGLDISPSMIEFAKSQIERGNHCEFILDASTSLDPLESESLDLVFSYIVLQHIAPGLTRKYFKAFARILKPAGLLVFQLPSRVDYEQAQNRKPFRMLRKRIHYCRKWIARKLSRADENAYFEMRAIRAHKVIRFLEDYCNFQLVAVVDYQSATPAWLSYLYVFRKRKYPRNKIIEGW